MNATNASVKKKLLFITEVLPEDLDSFFNYFLVSLHFGCWWSSAKNIYSADFSVMPPLADPSWAYITSYK